MSKNRCSMWRLSALLYPRLMLVLPPARWDTSKEKRERGGVYVCAFVGFIVGGRKRAGTCWYDRMIVLHRLTA